MIRDIFSLLIGGNMWSYLADTRGRRSMLLIGLIGSAIFNLIGTISFHWVMLLVFQFITAIFASGLYTMSMTLLSECVPIANRNTAVLIVFCVMFLGQRFMAMLALPIIPLGFSYHIPWLGIHWNSWRTLMAVFSLPCTTSAVFLYFMQESPKFIFTKGNEGKALKVLKTIYRINNRRSTEDLQVKGLLKDEVTATIGIISAKERIIPLFKAPLLKYTIIMTILNLAQQLAAFSVWLPKITDQFVRSIQTGEGSDLTVCNVLNMPPVPTDSNATPCALDETSLLIVLGIGVLQSIFNLCISFLINLVGRRNLTIFVISFSGISGILVNLVPNMIGSAVLFIMMIMGCVVVGLSTAICVALFPTNLRAIAVEFTMFAQYIGIIASIQILNLLLEHHCNVGFFLFSSLLTASAIVACFLPNDRQPQPVKEAPSEAATSAQ
ncbi:unnamed protein product [Arctia plantaginis]|uniref:Major facilitator superfamily (MFS) profile domain-containing protein n=1 Tax=Arctia plantaginis TaxID=874455 RepID=A0A8S0Z581_ARCPL|nr:unnamed protein product [Arctia plantaginis]